MPGDTDVIIVAAFVLADSTALGKAVPGLSSVDELDIDKLNVIRGVILRVCGVYQLLFNWGRFWIGRKNGVELVDKGGLDVERDIGSQSWDWR